MMKHWQAVVCAMGAACAAGCATSGSLRSDAALSRVVVYKNGVAYFERTAELRGERLSLSMPAAMVDDLLKSLRVLDDTSGAATPIASPTVGEPDAAGRVEVAIAPAGPRPRRLRLAYLSEAPVWKPSYRVTVREGGGGVDLEGWAIVDNGSGEDWNGVKLGIASSSALSFRYNLSTVRRVQREELGVGERFAQAPPLGGTSLDPQGARLLGELPADDVDKVGRAGLGTARVPVSSEPLAQAKQLSERVVELRETVRGLFAQAQTKKDVVLTTCLNDKLHQLDTTASLAGSRVSAIGQTNPRDVEVLGHELTVLEVLAQRAAGLAAESRQCIGQEVAFANESQVTATIDPRPPEPDSGDFLAIPPPGPPVEDVPDAAPSAGITKPMEGRPNVAILEGSGGRLDFEGLARRILRAKSRVRLLGFAAPGKATGPAIEESLRRATRLKEMLVMLGVPADRLEVVGVGAVAGRAAAVQAVEVDGDGRSAPIGAVVSDRGLPEEHAGPTGSAHFEAQAPVTLAAGRSAMVGMVHQHAEGEIVYLFDPDSERGDARFAFRALRLVNPTGSTLDSGPVTVFDEQGFIGEGLAEPIVAGGTAFVPFALDRQVVVERTASEDDRIERILALQGGVFGAAVRRIRTARYALHNRGGKAVTAWLRHTPAQGFELSPPGGAKAEVERIGGAALLRVELAANATTELVVEETAVGERDIDIHSAAGADRLRAFLRRPDADPKLVQELGELLDQAKGLAELQGKIDTRREQVRVYRERMHDLHGELQALKDLKSGRKTRETVERRLDEIGGELGRLTSEVVALQEDLLGARMRMRDALLRMTLDPPRVASK